MTNEKPPRLKCPTCYEQVKADSEGRVSYHEVHGEPIVPGWPREMVKCDGVGLEPIVMDDIGVSKAGPIVPYPKKPKR
jgi:hypothetical protein